MSFSELNKEQKQMVVLAVMAVVVVIALGNQLILGPAKEKAKVAERMMQDKGKERTLGTRMLNRDQEIKNGLGKMGKELIAKREEGLIPPQIGKEFWAQKRLTDLGYKLGLSLTVTEHNALRHIPLREKGDIKKADVSFWVPYAVEVNTRSDYGSVIDFLNKVYEQDPYASLARLQVTASEKDPIRHDVLMIFEWPTPRLEEDILMLQSFAEVAP